MKQIILLLTIFVFATVAFAQPTNPRFDADLKRLNRRFENVETVKRAEVDNNTEIRIKRLIESAERELERFKEKYPDYDVSKFERDLANFKNPKSSSSPTNKSGTNSSAEVSDYAKVENLIETIDEILDFQPDIRKFIRNEEDSLELTKQQLKDFQAKMQKTITPEFIALANDTTNRKLKRISEKAGRESKSLNVRLSSADSKRIKEDTNPSSMLSKYFTALFGQEKLKLLSKIYGNDADISEANKVADNLIAELGTLEQIEKQGEANKADLIARTRLYPNRQNDPALKNLFMRAFKSSVFTQGEFAQSEILKVHLVSSGWSVKLNKVTGIILSRDQQAHLAVKTTNGKCYSYLILLEQKHQGGGKYSGGYMRSGSNQEMLCENVPK